VEGVDEYAAWAPILATMVEYLIAHHKFATGDEGKLSDVLVGMLDDNYKLFKSELNAMIDRLQNTIEAHEEYEDREETQSEKAKKLKRRGDMILQLCKRFCEDHEAMIVLHLKVGTTQISRKKDAYSWDLAQRFARWLRARTEKVGAYRNGQPAVFLLGGSMLNVDNYSHVSQVGQWDVYTILKNFVGIRPTLTLL
jgi:hypothetical protein